MQKERIYLDYNATTPCDPRVVEEMMPFFQSTYGNASSSAHIFGWEAREAVDIARERVAELIGSEPAEIVFTSGATEAINLAIKGAYEIYNRKGSHIITCASEHKAVLDTCQWLEKRGAEVSYLQVGSDGRLSLARLEEEIREDTVLLSVMGANNETGVVQDLRAIGEICARKGVLFFCDATQMPGKLSVEVKEIQAHFLVFSSHKMYGPKGVGALCISKSRPRVRIASQIHGGGHEYGFRSGTLNVPGIAGFGKAAEIAANEWEDDHRRMAGLRDSFESKLGELEEVFRNGNREKRLPNVSNLAFRFVDSNALLGILGAQLACSAGSACSSDSFKGSHVLKAMSLGQARSRSSIRFSFGKFSTEADAERAVQMVKRAVRLIREREPLWRLFQAGNGIRQDDFADYNALNM